MSTAMQNSTPTPSYFISGQHFLETFTLLPKTTRTTNPWVITLFLSSNSKYNFCYTMVDISPSHNQAPHRRKSTTESQRSILSLHVGQMVLQGLHDDLDGEESCKYTLQQQPTCYYSWRDIRKFHDCWKITSKTLEGQFITYCKMSYTNATLSRSRQVAKKAKGSEIDDVVVQNVPMA